MPEHVHLIVWPTETASNVDKLLWAIKRPYSYRIKQILTTNGSPLLGRLTIRQRPGVTTFRFWQEGPGYDRNLTEPKSLLAAIEYVHLNPVRRGFCDRASEWRWSSARWFESEGNSIDPALPRLWRMPAEWLTGLGARRT